MKWSLMVRNGDSPEGLNVFSDRQGRQVAMIRLTDIEFYSAASPWLGRFHNRFRTSFLHQPQYSRNDLGSTSTSCSTLCMAIDSRFLRISLTFVMHNNSPMLPMPIWSHLPFNQHVRMTAVRHANSHSSTLLCPGRTMKKMGKSLLW